MHISRVLVRNFRNFKELLIDPYPRNAVIVGVNGVGKSNLLHALRIVMDPSLPESARHLGAEDISDYADSALEDGVEVRIEVDISGFGYDHDSLSVFDECMVSHDPMTARLIYVFRRRAGHGTPGELTADDYEWKVFGAVVDGKEVHHVRRHLPLNVLPALRDVVRDLSRWHDSPLQELLGANPPTPGALEAAAKAIATAMDQLAQDGPITKIAGNLGRRLDDLAGPQMDVEPALGFASGKPDRLLRSTKLYTDAQRFRNVADASSGHANVIYFGLLLERFAVRRRKEAVLDSLLAVEEPEAHLHPVLQRQLFRALLRGGTSLTVTTHSPNIAAVSPVGALIQLRSVPGQGTIAVTGTQVDVTDSQRADLERYLTVSRAELLFCSAAILVEGPSEAYLLPALARVLGFDLDSYGVIIADVAGTDFVPYRALLGSDGLDVPHVIITDGDPVRRLRGEQRRVYAGLRRAAKLISEAGDSLSPDSADFGVPPSSLIDSIAEDPSALLAVRLAAAEGDVFVGLDTLEVDIAPMLEGEMLAAFGELQSSRVAVGSFNSAVRAIAGHQGSDEDRDELLRRIEDVGKGRLAQRLAEHIATSPDLGEWVTEPFTSREPTDDTSQRGISTEELMKMDSFGYLLAALDRVSRMVRHRGLLPVEDFPFPEDGDD